MKINRNNLQQNIVPNVTQAKMLDYVQRLERENRLLRQGQLPITSVQAAKTNLQGALPPELMPGNIGEITKVIWPFFFPARRVRLEPGQSDRGSFTVTQEAAFVMTSLTKVVHREDGGGLVSYIDPRDFDVAVGGANDLVYTMRDASSSREFQSLPLALDHIGDPWEPTPFPTPMLVRENGTIEFQLTNNSLTETYHAVIMGFGYRIRISQFEKILSQVTG